MESSSCQSRLFHRKLGRLERKQGRFGLVTFGAGADGGHDGHHCKFRVHEEPEARRTVISAGGVQARSLVVGDTSGSRDVGYPIPKVGLLGERPTISGGREKTQRDGFPCKVESDAGEGAVVKATKVLLAPSMRKEKGQLTVKSITCHTACTDAHTLSALHIALIVCTTSVAQL